MRHPTRLLGVLWLLAGVALFSSPAWSQTGPPLSASPKAGTAGASGAPDFVALINQDVANKLYTQAQGDQMIAKIEAAQARLDTGLNRASNNLTDTVSLLSSNDQMQLAASAVAGAKGANGQLQLGGTPQQINEQATALYTALDQATRLYISLQQAIQPLVQDYLDEVSSILSERASLISANPSVSAEQKFYVQQEANKVQLQAASTLNKDMSTNIAMAQAALARLESNRTQVIQTFATVIAEKADQINALAAQSPTPPANTSTPAAQNPPTPQPDATTPNSSNPLADAQQSVPASPSPPASSPYVKPSSTGTIPSNAPDPALSASRGTSSGAGTGTNPSATGTSPPVTGAQSDQALNANRNQPTGSGAGAAAAASANPPPPPLIDPLAQLNAEPPLQIPKLPIGTAKTGDLPGGGTSNGQGGFNPTPTNSLGLPLGVGPSNTPAGGASNTGGGAGTATGSANGADGNTGGSGGGNVTQQAYNTVKSGNGGNPTEDQIVQDILRNIRPGVLHLVDDVNVASNGSVLYGTDSGVPDDLQSIEYGDTITVATLLPIYAGYSLTDNTGAAMMSLNLQVPVPSAVMTVPSFQITGMPSDVMTVPSYQIAGVPSSVMTSPNPQPSLCGR